MPFGILVCCAHIKANNVGIGYHLRKLLYLNALERRVRFSFCALQLNNPNIAPNRLINIIFFIVVFFQIPDLMWA
jgi:hypothetical protein